MRDKVVPVTGGAGDIGRARFVNGRNVNGDNVACGRSQAVSITPWRSGPIKPV